MIPNHNKIIAVDFDGTIVEDAYPKIGEPKLFAFQTLTELQKKGYRLILWTVRQGRTLDEAVDFCKKNGLKFYAVNKNYPEEVLDERTNRKVNADIFIDDRNFGTEINWGEIYQELLGPNTSSKRKPPKKPGLFTFFR